MVRPNFFIVGAPKSGTTSLHRYLAEHPDVLMSDPKEPSYLAPDFSSPLFCQTEQDYLRCFQGHRGQRRIGESSTSYLYSKTAARRIFDFAPDARIIAMLRNPIDMVPSLHAQYLKMGVEDICRFEDALAAESDRARGKRIPKGFPFPAAYLLYRKVAEYAEQLARYHAVFGRDRVHVVVFDDFQRNAEEQFVAVCHFLGISPDWKPTFAVHNPTRIPRWAWLHRVAFRLRRMDGEIVRNLHPTVGSWLRASLEWLHGVMAHVNLHTTRAAVARETRSLLRSHFEQEISQLEADLGRSLNAWRRAA